MSSLSIFAAKKNNATNKHNDIMSEKHMGLWYEVARSENRRDRGVRNATVFYKMTDQNSIKAIMSGYRNGKYIQKTDIIKIGKRTMRGFLTVSFFFNLYSHHRIVMLADNFNCFLIADRHGKFRILSRKPYLNIETLDRIIDSARMYGFRTENLIFN